MPAGSVRAVALGFAFGTGRFLFQSLDFQLRPGWTGLVGPNGAGKSTLLELLSGERDPSAGRVEHTPHELRIIRCDQRVEPLSPELSAFAENAERQAFALRGRLGLAPEALHRWPTLSPGERRRWQLACALAAEPDLLLLDEPTNHLDADAAGWLSPELRSFRGIGVLVSHDRALLDAVTTSTLMIADGTARLWPGSWSQAHHEQERERQTASTAHQQARDRLKRAEKRVQRAKTELASASAQRSTGKRMKSKHDSDARTMGAANRAEHAQTSLAGRFRAEKNELQRARDLHASTSTLREIGGSFTLGHQRAPRPNLISLSLGELSAGTQRIFGPLSLTWGREERVWVRGPNGCGKSTLLRALADLRRPGDALLSLPQELTLEQTRAAGQTLRGLEDQPRGRVLQWLAVLGVRPSCVLESPALSPGEARKLVLALGLGQEHWGLLLDEPTHHLDAPAIERLEAALAAFPGALILATHDERFAAGCTRTCWRIRAEQVIVE
jgi:ATPase subunit of ABC transporter with duplicated ATPase domains